MTRFIYCCGERRYNECRVAECPYAECRVAECYYAECRGAHFMCLCHIERMILVFLVNFYS